MYYKNLGEITHYVADYFTFPHNKTYPGTLKDHCTYEEKLKQDLRAFLKTEKAKQIGRDKDRDFTSLEDLFSYIKQQHEAYLKKRSNVEKDIEHIVVINRQLVDAISQLFHNNKSHHNYRSVIRHKTIEHNLRRNFTMSEFKNLTLDVADGIAVLAISRPAALNALNSETLDELNVCLREI